MTRNYRMPEWTEEQDALALELHDAGESFAAIGEAIGRSEKAAIQRLQTLRARRDLERTADVYQKPSATFRHRNLTAQMMGDPPPGRSALDQRQRQG